MTTIASLNVRMGADITGLRTGFRDAVNLAQQFARQTANIKPPQITVGSARAVVDQLRQNFADEASRLKFDLVKGLISPAQFRVAGVRSAEEFNIGIVKTLAALESSGKLTGKLREQLLAEMKSIGEGAAQQLRAEIKNALQSVDESAFGKLGNTLQGIGRKLTLSVTTPLVGLGTLGTHLAAEAEETASIFGRVFGREADRTTAALEQLQAVIPRTTDDLQRMALQMQAALIPLGIAPDRAAEMSVALVKLAGDLALLRRTSPEEVLERMRLSMLGNIRGLKEFNVALREENIQAAAVTLGIAQTGKELTAQQRALTIYAALMEKTRAVQGLSTIEAGKQSQAFKFLKRDLQEAAEQIGHALLPVLVPIARTIGDVARAFSALSPEVRKTIVTVGLLVAVLGPALTIIGGIILAVGKFVTIVSILKTFGLTLGTIGTILAPGGLVVIGLGLLAAALGIVAVNSIKAQIETAKLKSELQKLSKEKLQVSADELFLDLQRLERTRRALVDKPVPLFAFNPIGATRDLQQLVALDKQIAETRNQLKAIAEVKASQPVADLAASAADLAALMGGTAGGLDVFSQSLNKGKSAAEQFAERAERLLDLFRSLKSRGLDTTVIAQAILTTFDAASTQLGRIKDQIGDDATALRRAIDEFRGEDIVKTLRLGQVITIPTQLDFAVSPDARENIRAFANSFAQQGNLAAGEFVKSFDVRLRDLPAALDKNLKQFKPLKPVHIPLEIDIPTKINRTRIDQALFDFGEQITAVTVLQNQLTLAEAKGTSGIRDQIAARERLRGAIENLKRAMANLGKIAIEGNADDQKKALAALQEALRKLAEAGVDVQAVLGQSSTKLGQFVARSRSLAATARGFDLINDSAQRALDAVVSVLDQLDLFKQAKGSGDVFGQITAGLGLIGSVISFGKMLFGPSPDEEARRSIIRNNTQELARMRLEIAGWRNSVGQQAELSRRLSAPALQSAVDKLLRSNANNFINNVQAFLAEFEKLGISMQDLAAIAKDNGITILDEKGKFVAAGLAQLAEKLRLAALAATRFANTLSDQTTLQQLRNKLNQTLDTGAQQVADAFALLKQLAPKLFEQFFSGVDLNDSTAVRTATRRLLDAWVAQMLDPAMFGALGEGDLEELVNRWLDGLGRMTEAANEVSDSLLNVPQGFKLERARFNATLADDLRSITATFDQLQLDKNKLRLSTPTSTTTSSDQTGGDTFNFLPGSVVINGSELTPSQMFDGVILEGKRRARGKFGLYGAPSSVLDNS